MYLSVILPISLFNQLISSSSSLHFNDRFQCQVDKTDIIINANILWNVTFYRAAVFQDQKAIELESMAFKKFRRTVFWIRSQKVEFVNRLSRFNLRDNLVGCCQLVFPNCISQIFHLIRKDNTGTIPHWVCFWNSLGQVLMGLIYAIDLVWNLTWISGLTNQSTESWLITILTTVT